jgi:hypothetical protein
VQTQRYHAADAEKVAIVPFTSDPLHKQLAELSKECHRNARQGDWRELAKAEKSLDECAAQYWQISGRELARIREGLATVSHDPNQDSSTGDESD